MDKKLSDLNQITDDAFASLIQIFKASDNKAQLAQQLLAIAKILADPDTPA